MIPMRARCRAAAYSLSFDMERARHALNYTDDTYRQSALAFMRADSTDLSKFKGHGGKLVIVHGVSDPVPDQIIATARTTSPWPGRTRPLCPYPKQAHYKGTGSIEDAQNFTCQ